MNPPPVLILTAAFGDGHNAAAQGLAAAIRLRGGTAHVADPFAESRPKLNDFFRRLYLTLINRYPHFWNLFYVACHHLPLIENTLFVNQPAYLRLRQIIETLRPRVIVLTFPVYAHLIARLLVLLLLSLSILQSFWVLSDRLDMRSCQHRVIQQIDTQPIPIHPTHPTLSTLSTHPTHPHSLGGGRKPQQRAHVGRRPQAPRLRTAATTASPTATGSAPRSRGSGVGGVG